MKRSTIKVLAPIATLALSAALFGGTVSGATEPEDDDAAVEEAEDDAEDEAEEEAEDDPEDEAEAEDDAEDDAEDEPETEAVAEGDSLLDVVRDRGTLRCGVRDDLPGFSAVDEEGDHVGFDADFCRVIAAGVLGDADAVEFIDLETPARFTALQSGEVDVLVRNTTWTASRDGTEGATFLHTTFYDGQAMMVAADSGLTSIDEMDGAVVCVAAGTTTEGNVATEFERRGLSVDVQSFEDVDALQEAFIAERCDGWSSDYSQLVALSSTFDDPEVVVFADEIFSKEPLGPAVVDGDTAWAQAVNWAVMAPIAAEEMGLTSENVDEADLDDPLIALFLGAEVDGTVLDAGLGLDADFNYNIVSQVGNYGEIYDATLVPIGIERGLNALWSDGGLQYVPPYR